MKSIDEVYQYVIERISIPEVEESLSRCDYRNDEMYEASLKGKVVSGCFYIKESNTEAAQRIIEKLQKSPLSLRRPPRQDYLKWTFEYSATKDYLVTFAVDTIEDTEDESSEDWKMRLKDYKSFMYIHVYDETGK